jgi:hypothetical protein
MSPQHTFDEPGREVDVFDKKDPIIVGAFPHRSALSLAATMDLRDFRIGVEFWSGGKRWRCTDVGTRVIVAISLEPHEVIEVVPRKGTSVAVEERRHITSDPSWHNGPPYPIVEHVFDEDGMEDCSLTPEVRDSANGG